MESKTRKTTAMMSRTTAVVLAFAMWTWCGFGGCNDDEGDCGGLLVFGLVVVVDSDDGTPVCDATVSVVLDGKVVQTLSKLQSLDDGDVGCSYQGGTGISGPHDLSITAPGYSPKTVQSVVIPPESAKCHQKIYTEDVHVVLEPT